MPNTSSKSLNTRAIAARCIAAVFEGRSLDAALAEAQADLPGEDQRFLQALAYGVLRDWRLLQWLARQLMDKAPRKNATLLEALLCVGLFQLRSLNQPARAAVHSSVQAARELKLDWAAGLVNAILRRYQREQEKLEAGLPDDAGLRFSHPKWLLRELIQDWGERHALLLEQNNQPGPMWLRVNRQQTTRDAYLEELVKAGIDATTSAHCPDALQLTRPLAVSALPGFAAGAVSVQDAAAQLAAALLDPQPGQRILDACAAPGGKTGHLLERQADIELLALDSQAQRLARVEENLERLQLLARTQCADAAATEFWWDGQPFDAILLDAPCSGTGVIRRHPDIKWLRRADDIPALAAKQRHLLKALWPTLKRGGQLLYATCSVLQAEGDAVIEAFLEEQPDAGIRRIEGSWGEATCHGRRIITGQDGMDGFYYALLTKTD